MPDHLQGHSIAPPTQPLHAGNALLVGIQRNCARHLANEPGWNRRISGNLQHGGVANEQEQLFSRVAASR
jgi:hypothetical protein